MLLGLAGEKGNAERLRLHHLGRHLVEHRNATRHVKAADADRKPAGDKGPCQIDGARELVRLHADQPDQRAAALFLDHAHDPAGADAPVGLVIGVEAEVDAGAEDLTAPRVFGERKQAGQRVGGNGRTHPLNGVAVVVVMRRLDHDEMKRFRALRLHRHPSIARSALGLCRLATDADGAKVLATEASLLLSPFGHAAPDRRQLQALLH